MRIISWNCNGGFRKKFHLLENLNADIVIIQAKSVLKKYNGIPKESFPLFLKECEFRFNYGSPKQQLLILREWAEI